jgi:fatty-acyl-CoA synthase
VGQICVIGGPSENWGEEVKAVVVLRPEIEGADELAAELMALVKDAKGSIQAPKSIDFVAGIPLTNVGKPDKKVLRAQYWKDSDRAV